MLCLARHPGWKTLMAEVAVDSVGPPGRRLVGAQSLFDGWDTHMPFFLMNFYNMQGSTGGHLPLYKQSLSRAGCGLLGCPNTPWSHCGKWEKRGALLWPPPRLLVGDLDTELGEGSPLTPSLPLPTQLLSLPGGTGCSEPCSP